MGLYFVGMLSLVLSKKEISISVLPEMIMAGHSAVCNSTFLCFLLPCLYFSEFYKFVYFLHIIIAKIGWYYNVTIFIEFYTIPLCCAYTDTAVSQPVTAVSQPVAPSSSLNDVITSDNNAGISVLPELIMADVVPYCPIISGIFCYLINTQGFLYSAQHKQRNTNGGLSVFGTTQLAQRRK